MFDDGVCVMATTDLIAKLRRLHGPRAVRVSGQAKARRARCSKAEAWVVVSYPAKTKSNGGA